MILGTTQVAYDYLPTLSASYAPTADLFRSEPSVSELGAAPWRYLMLPALHTIKRLASLGENWDGYGSAATTPQIAAKAWRMLLAFYDTYYPVDLFIEPFVSLNEDGEITLEWWQGPKKLTVYIGETGCRYLLSWGPDMLSEMDDGKFSDENIPTSLWHWLHG